MSPSVTAWPIVFVFVQQWSTTAQRRRTHIYQALVTLGWCVLGSIVWCYLWFVDSKKNKEYISPRMSSNSLTCLVRVTEQCLLLSSEPGTGPVLHPGCYGELVCQILRNHPVRDFSRLTTIKPEDQVTVPATVSHQGSCPVGGSAGGREKVSAARGGPWGHRRGNK